jgi:hypothetical protein
VASAGLAVEARRAPLVEEQHVAHRREGRRRQRQRTGGQPLDQIDLLARADAERTGQPELVDAAGDVAVAVPEALEAGAHAVLAEADRQGPEVRHR